MLSGEQTFALSFIINANRILYRSSRSSERFLMSQSSPLRGMLWYNLETLLLRSWHSSLWITFISVNTMPLYQWNGSSRRKVRKDSKLKNRKIILHQWNRKRVLTSINKITRLICNNHSTKVILSLRLCQGPPLVPKGQLHQWPSSAYKMSLMQVPHSSRQQQLECSQDKLVPQLFSQGLQLRPLQIPQPQQRMMIISSIHAALTSR
jgi:hypothetical protein